MKKSNEPYLPAIQFAWDDPLSPYNWERFTKYGLPVKMVSPEEDHDLYHRAHHPA